MIKNENYGGAVCVCVCVSDLQERKAIFSFRRGVLYHRRSTMYDFPERRNDYFSDYRSRGGGGYNQTMSSSNNSNKKKTTSQTNLPDGSRVKEYIIEEANPDGSKTITTTTVRTTKEKRTLRDGSQVTEDVSTTTTATRHIPGPVPSPHQQQQQERTSATTSRSSTPR